MRPPQREEEQGMKSLGPSSRCGGQKNMRPPQREEGTQVIFPSSSSRCGGQKYMRPPQREGSQGYPCSLFALWRSMRPPQREEGRDSPLRVVAVKNI